MKIIKVKKYVSFFIGTDSAVYSGEIISQISKIENGYLIHFKSGQIYYASTVKTTDSEQEVDSFAAGDSIDGW